MDSKMNKKGQTTIFVIVASLIVASIIIFYLIFRSPVIDTGQDYDNPESFLDSCLREEARDLIDEMLPQGGFYEPHDFKVYNNINVAYLCKNINNYEPCITQYPRYISTIEENLEKYLKIRAEECFIILEEELDKRNYQYSGGEVEVEVALKPDLVEITTLRDFSIGRNDYSRNYNSFNLILRSPFYDLARIANEIVYQEARFCYFEYVGFMALYPKYDVRKFTFSDSTKIYTLKDKESGVEMNIAVRGCAIPSGF